MGQHILFNHSQVNICLERLAYQLLENHDDFSETVLIGLQPRGRFLSENMVNILKNKYDLRELDYGYLDITFFRDDFRTKSDILIPNESNFKLNVNNKKVVFIDDVLYTGRTIRAALTAIESFGRPKSIELLILINRRYSRELPIQADYKGFNVDVYEDQKVYVNWSEKNNYVYLENIK
ncbi:MAG: bifunctional pyr operon transcriptional regulator/uracil phosphoribosyltransferase [Bacteroidetes bacterium MED-G13]|nr:MAG: bifunctional pyr operon transcriptional regulator/uracil phosphoribosyltransferase [Bacteroidetes bacterium MED-G13]|tara:strand:- start:23783 stop:24319 length:537 start_codon:yes stop_codon:yes gene_type:complete